ncbi:MAG TPA: efflux transporter outer membrane subunit [Steroidobacteraceae bacterium]|nr:efflux transporter outer membrane subunit [Steroidobacteraceae bacterium]
MKRLLVAALATALAGCTLVPSYRRPPSPVANRWPADAPAGSSAAAPGAGTPGMLPADIGWQEFFTDPRLERLVAIALENNRNLRIAVLNIEASQAELRIQRAPLFPSISVTGAGLIEKLPRNGGFAPGTDGGGLGTSLAAATPGAILHEYSAGLGFSSYLLDLFGRERSLTQEAFEQYLAQRYNRRSVEISLVSEVASDYFSVLADQALVKLSRDTLRSDKESYEITQAAFDHDRTTLLALRQSESAVDGARASLAQYRGQLAKDTHALVLVLGEPIPKDLPAGETIEREGLLEQVPAGLPSELLARRPDILSAEHALEAANANIGAARAAFFPSIELTASGGTASSSLSNLFAQGTGTWAFAPTINLPIFTGGENRANLDLAHVEKNIAVAKYELAIQTAFREASDALAARGTYRDQLEAQQALASADADAYRLADMRFRAGIDSYLPTLTAQLSLYSARQQLITLRQADLANEVTLYEALGGGWKRRMEVARNDSDRVIRAAVRRFRRNSVRGSARGR